MTFLLILTLIHPDGAVEGFVVDHGLTAEDCLYILDGVRPAPGYLLECEAEGERE